MMLKVEPQSPPPPINNVPYVALEENQRVWPWVGVLANIPIQYRNGSFSGPNGLILKQHLTQSGLNPLKVEVLWGNRGHSGFALVEFDNDFNGYNNAVIFETAFQESLCGKTDWNNAMLGASPTEADNFKLYGWIAGEDDYMFHGIVGHHLRNFKEVFNVKERVSLLSGLDTHFVSKRMHHNHSKRSKVDGSSMCMEEVVVLCSNEDMRKDLDHQYHSVRKQEIEMRSIELVEKEVQGKAQLRKIKNEKYVCENVESLSQIDRGTSSLPDPAYKSSQTPGNQFSFTKFLMDVESLSQIEQGTF